MPKHIPRSSSALCILIPLFFTGCHADRQTSGDRENVQIATPFGGMSVKTNEAAVEGGVGLSIYPGATLIKKDSSNGAADVNMNFGAFHLGVKALNFHSPDSPEQVTSFYRKDMTRYGVVLLCQGNHPVSQPDHTREGLSCDDSKGGHVHVDTDDARQELKAGSRLHQHIVSIDPEGSGTKIALVALDLPGSSNTSGTEGGGQ